MADLGADMTRNNPLVEAITVMMRKFLKGLTRKLAPELSFLYAYHRALRHLGNQQTAAYTHFADLVANSTTKRCLQIGVKDNIGRKYAPHWVSVDKYDTRPFIDYQYDIHDLGFADDEFDVAVCVSVLEHVPQPLQAIAELHRVLKPGGLIWVQLPFCYPYHESPRDYWRVSPDGLRLWMQHFDEIACGAFAFTRSPLAVSTFFYGRKAEGG